MAKKNRAPRPEIDHVYLDKDANIPGVFVVDPVTKQVVNKVADRCGYFTPEHEEGFDRKKYREWRQEMIAKWRGNEPHGGVIAINP